MWFVQPIYILVEVVTAAKTTAAYSFADNTISDLAAGSCGSIDYPFGAVAVCSPWHGLMNTSFIVFGLFLAIGGIVLGSRLPAGKSRTVSVLLWLISGLSSIMTGLVPLNVDLELHTLVSTPAFLAQPAALMATGWALRRHRPGLAWSALATGVVSAAGAVAFLVRFDSADFGGLLERLALWPTYLWVPAMALTFLPRPRIDLPCPARAGARSAGEIG